MEPMGYNEKASPAVQSNAPVQESKESAVKQFWYSSTSDKLWHLTQVPALLYCILLVICSSCAYFMSDYVNCDGYSPYSQALLSGMYAMLLCMNSYLYAHHLRDDGKELDSPNALSPQTRRTRRQRRKLKHSLRSIRASLPKLRSYARRSRRSSMRRSQGSRLILRHV